MAKSKTLIAYSVYRSDAFLGLSTDARALYTHLCFECDGMGCIESSPASACRIVGVARDAYEELVSAGFVLELEQSGETVPVLAHHWVNNKRDSKNFCRGRWANLLAEKLVFQSSDNKRYAPRAAAPDGVPLDSILPLAAPSPDENKGAKGDGAGARSAHGPRRADEARDGDAFTPRTLSPDEAEGFGAYPYGKSDTIIAQGCPSCSGHISLTRIGEDGTEPYWLCAQGHRFPFDAL